MASNDLTGGGLLLAVNQTMYNWNASCLYSVQPCNYTTHLRNPCNQQLHHLTSPIDAYCCPVSKDAIVVTIATSDCFRVSEKCDYSLLPRIKRRWRKKANQSLHGVDPSGRVACGVRCKSPIIHPAPQPLAPLRWSPIAADPFLPPSP